MKIRTHHIFTVTILLFLLTAFFIYFFAYLCFETSIDHRKALIVELCSLFSLIYIPVFMFRKEYFSLVEFSNEGLQASFLGKTWFQAAWEDVMEVGEFDVTHGRVKFHWIYISKVPIVVDKSLFTIKMPHSKKVDYNALFILSSPKRKEKIITFLIDKQVIQTKYQVAQKGTYDTYW